MDCRYRYRHGTCARLRAGRLLTDRRDQGVSARGEGAAAAGEAGRGGKQLRHVPPERRYGLRAPYALSGTALALWCYGGMCGTKAACGATSKGARGAEAGGKEAV
eukprot:1507662-Rhodomonas_salina.3